MGVAVVIVVIIGALAVLAIAWYAIGVAVRRLGPEPARQVFEYDEAFSFIIEALPSDVTAQLSYEDVQRILRLHLDFLHRQGVSRSGGDLPEGDGPIVLDPADGADYVLRRGAVVHFHPDRAHVLDVIAAQLAYFEAIGAMAEVDGPDLSVAPRVAPLPSDAAPPAPGPGPQRAGGAADPEA